MKIITKYLCKTAIAYILLVMLFLFGLQMFIEFIREFPNIGEGNYGIYQMFCYVLLMLPQDIYQFFPMACLLGAVVALGLLASHSELMVMRASGMSLVNIAVAIIKATIFLLVIMTIIGEVLSPMAQRKAAKVKTAAISSGQALLTKQGVWLYKDNSFINIKSVIGRGELQGVTRYQFASDKKLLTVSYADDAVYHGGKWTFNKIVQTVFKDNVIDSLVVPQQQWTFGYSPKLIGLTHMDTDQKSLVEIHSYIKHRIKSGLNAVDYKIVWWQRIFAPLTTVVMVLLAIPFVFGPLRSATMGLRLLLGIMVGFGFYILHQFVGPMSVVYHVPAVVAAALPSLIFAAIGVLFLIKAKRHGI